MPRFAGEVRRWVTGRGAGPYRPAQKSAPRPTPCRPGKGEGGWKKRFLAPSGHLGGRRADSDQVRKKCAEPNLVCVAVSRFSKTPTQNNFSETQSVHQNRSSRAGVQSGAPGYMRKQKPGLVERLVWADAPLQPPRCLWCCGGGPGWRYPKGGPAAALGYSLPPYLFHIRMIFTAWSFVQRWCFGPAAGDS